MFLAVTIIGSTLLLTGCVLLLLGLRGHRVDDHALCRKCGYDLSGPSEIPDVCPECGRDLLPGSRHLRMGNRRRKPAWMVAGLLLILISLGGGGTYAYNEMQGFDWATVKPMWLLKREARATGPGGDTARRELLRRLQADLLSDLQRDDLVELALTMQGDASLPWESIWGTIVEHVWQADQLAEQQIQRYVQQAFDVTFVVETRDRIRSGSPLPMRMGVPWDVGNGGWRLASARISNFPVTTLSVLADPVLVTIDGTQAEYSLTPRHYRMVQAGSLFLPVIDLALPVGRHDVVLTFDCTSWGHPSAQQFRWLNGKLQIPDDQRLTQWTVQRTISIDVMEQDQPAVTMIEDDSLLDAVRKSIVQVEFIRSPIPYPSSPNRGRGGQFGGRNGMIIIDAPPMDLSFDVFVRVGEEEHKIGGITARQSEGLQNAQRLATHPAKVFPEAATIDLILRASPTPAERTLDIDRVWDGEIVIEDVPIRATDGADAADGGS